ncbi:MAG: glutathione S-transferase family protein [Halieaceae bacterium]
MKIYGANVSPFVRKVLVVAAAKGLDFEHEPVMPGSDDAEFRLASPIGKIPGFMDGELRVSDSSIICEYLEEKYPAVRMQPDTPELRARARWYEEYADTKFVEMCTAFFFERIAKKLFGDDSGPDEARLKQVAEELAPVTLAYVESQVPDSGFLFGDDLYIADVALISPTVNAAYGGYEIDAQEFPKVAAYRARVMAHPAMAGVLEVERAMLAALTA